MRVELNPTFRCQLACPGCDRLCSIIPPDPADDMTPEQVSAFIREANQRGIRVERIKIVGGEPFTHIRIVELLQVLIHEGIGSGVVGSIKLDTNGVAKPPADLPMHPNFRIGGRKPKKKIHLPYLWSPFDLGLEWKCPCSHPFRCGYSLDARGWQLCSPAIMIDRLFYDGKHYQQNIPTKPWGAEDLGRHCIYAAPAWFREANAKPLSQFTPEMKSPTKSWAEALRQAGVEVARIYEPQIY